MLQSQSSQDIIEFPSHFFDQAMSLMHEAQHYFDILSCDESIETDPKLWLQYTTEMSMITLRLSSIIAWVIARKQLLSGVVDIPTEEQRIHLKGRFIGSMHNPESTKGLPPYLKYLLESSHSLFMQAINLEDQADALKEVHPGLELVKS